MFVEDGLPRPKIQAKECRMETYEVRLRSIDDGVCGYAGVDGWPALHMPIDSFEEEPPVTLVITISVSEEPASKTKKETK